MFLVLAAFLLFSCLLSSKFKVLILRTATYSLQLNMDNDMLSIKM